MTVVRFPLLARVAIAAVALAVGIGCARRDPAGAAPAPGAAVSTAPAPLDERLARAPMTELAFVPPDVEAVVRVDLGDVAARSPDPAESLKTFDFLFRAQQPNAWRVLRSAGITIGKEVTTLFLVVGPRRRAERAARGAPGTPGAPGASDDDSYLIAGLGRFDEVALGQALAKSGATVDRPAADQAIFLWRKHADRSVGATLPPESAGQLGAAAVGVAHGLLLFGSPDLVRRSLAVSAAAGAGSGDVRHGRMAGELLAIDPTATVWGVAHLPEAALAAAAGQPGATAAEAAPPPFLATLMPGLERGHFSMVLAAPGRDLDGMFLLRTEWSSPAQAAAFQKKLGSLLAAADLMGSNTPLGATFAEIRKRAKLTLDGKTLIASSSAGQ